MIKKTSAKTKTPVRAAAKPVKPVKAAAKIARPVRKRVSFRFEGTPGSEVRLAGSFNNWDPSAHLLSPQQGNGTYVAMLLLSPGRHEYKFVVDGKWLIDPFCVETVPDGHGAKNSVISVR